MSYTVKNKEIARLIIQMASHDQQARKLAAKDFSFWKEVKKVDRKNIERFKQIINQFGWPTTSLVGKRASHLAWLLAQHADSDVEFQEQCLELLVIAVKNKDAKKPEVAFLMDRVLVNNKKPQLYGTQFYADKNGKTIPKPIKNLRLLNMRRKEMDLDSFVEYRKQNQNWRRYRGVTKTNLGSIKRSIKRSYE